MHRVVARQLALLLFAAVCPASAFALSETYEGQLIPINNEMPISIVVQLEEMGGFLTGRVKVSSPFKGDAPIESGRNVAGYCNLAVVLSSSITLRLYGDCNTTTFEGKYAVYHTPSQRPGRGTFRLTRKIPVSGKGSGLSNTNDTAGYIVACVKANARCLAACPRGDQSVEYLCANHCRTKLQTCKGKANKLGIESE